MEKTRTRSFRPLNGLAASAERRLAAVMAALLLGVTTAAAATTGITVEKPWMRFIIKSRPAAGYFTLKNDTGSAIDLVGASSSACGMMMLHQSKEVNGAEKMLPVKSISIPAHGSVSFATGGYHLMCMSPANALTVGAKVPVTLKFADGSAVTAQFPVKGAGAK
jgi:periplasmic copper chaperone A